MYFAINSKAESRVLVPWEHLQFPNLTLQDSSGMHLSHSSLFVRNSAYADGVSVLDDFTPDWQGQGNVWEVYRRTCPPESAARQLYSSYRNPNMQKGEALLGKSQLSDDPCGFVKNVDVDYDFCENTWARYTQGHFFSDWRTIPVLAPVFSPSKARGFADIRIPSHYYQGGNPRYSYAYDPVTRDVKDIDDMEVLWDQKSDHIFWRGATTGGGSTPGGFAPTYQRHRCLSFLYLSSTHHEPRLAQIPPYDT